MTFDWVLYTLYMALLVLNVFDYVTTHIVLSYYEGLGPGKGFRPIWKETRLGKWFVRRGLVKPPIFGDVYYYDHELNPIGRWLLKYAGGVPSLAWFKFTVFLFITPQLVKIMRALPDMPDTLRFCTYMVYIGMDTMYIFVVANNHLVWKSIIRSASEPRPHKILQKKKKK